MAEGQEIEQSAEQQAEQRRGEDGRFAPQQSHGTDALRERINAEDLQNAVLVDSALKAGLIEPSDDMDPGTWRRAFEGRQAHADELSSPVRPGAAEGEAQAGEPEAGEATERDREILSSYHQRRASFESDHPDFVEVVDRAQLAEGISGPVQVAIIEDENGPALAYYLGEHPEICDRLNKLTAAGAVVEVGRIAERLAQRGQAYDASARAHLGVEIPPTVVADYQRKAIQLRNQQPLSEEESGIARAVAVAPHVSQTIIAMGRPDIAWHLVRNVGVVGRLNAMHPMAAAGELASIAHELDRESPQSERHKLPAPITPTRKSSSTDSGLSDSLSAEEWARRFKKKMGYQ